ncbi:RtcB family protein [Peptococcaceae bacterium]|nr:RtcB family protein [Peptococcaceae bacterium]
MIEIKGKYNKAVVHTEMIEPEAHNQIQRLCNQEFVKDEKIIVMPDVHAGKGCVIGLTMTTKNEKIVPNLIGVDIGCGVLAVELTGIKSIDYEALDYFIKKYIPSGYERHTEQKHDIVRKLEENIRYVSRMIKDDAEIHLASIGTLGGGNHFIEVAKSNAGNLYLLVHTGSRNFGHKVASYYQKIAQKEYPELKSLAYLEGHARDEYLFAMRTAQEFAKVNREMIVSEILKFLEINKDVLRDKIDTPHNYLSDDGILRKGAIAAHKDKKVIIPFNMRDGAVIAVGKGVVDWNYSAPHGAGRVLSRTQAKKSLSLKEFQKQMEGIWTSSVKESTLDEAPDAYKPAREIMNKLTATAAILETLKPVYNFKA